MAKLTLTDLASLENETSAVSNINANNALIETAMEKTLSRDGTSPNTMSASLDMNNNRILNLPSPASNNEPARHGDIQQYVDDAEDSATAAAASASAASTSASTAQTYASSAETVVANSIGSGYYYKYDNGTSSGTSSGYVRFNNTNLSSATTLYINNSTSNTTDISSVIDTWDDSNSTLGKGTFLVTRVSDGKQCAFKITGTLTSLSGEKSFPITYISGLTSITDESALNVFFLPTGNDGAGSGTVTGPASSVDNTLPRFNGTSGIVLQTSGITVDDSNNVTGFNNTSGIDADFVTGTAGTNGNLLQWNSDGDAVDSSIAASSVYKSGGTDVAVADGGTGSSTASGARTNLAAANTTQSFAMSGLIATPSDKDFRIVVNCPYGGTITKTTTKSASGTCTATFKINTTALGGTANSVTSTEQEQTHASSNAFAAGDDIVITVSSNASCADMSFTILYSRTLS